MLLLLGLSPEASDAQLQDALAYVRRHNEHGAAVGGKRYGSGYMEGWTASEWSSHSGETWPWFRAMRTRVDPRGQLNNAHIRWR